MTSITPAQPAVPPMVFITREVNIRKFFGDDSSRALEFEEDVRRAWKSQPDMDRGRQLDILLSNVGPVVRSELRCQDPVIQQDPELALAAIVSTFGDQRSTATLLRDFLTTEQHSGETVRAFSHRLRESYEGLVRRQSQLSEPVTPEVMLRDRFINALGERSLASYIREQVHADPSLTFRDVREVALRWVGTTDPHQRPGATAAAVSTTPASRPLEDRVDKIEKLLEQLVLQRTSAPAPVRAASEFQRRGRDRQGRPVCFRCGDQRHRVRDCPRPQQAGNESSLL